MEALKEAAVTVVVVIDYGVDQAAAWADLRRSLRGIAAQDIEEHFDVFFVESRAHAERIPDDLVEILPALRILISDGTTAYDLVLDGAREANTELFATLDADSVPDPSWLRYLVAAIRARPDAAAVCGRTTYGNRGFIFRILAILQRAPLEAFPPGEMTYVTNNNAIFQRSVFFRHPLTNEVGPFGTGLHGKRVRSAGYRLYHEPAAHVVHSHDGWRFEYAVRTQTGFASIRSRQIDRSLPRAWLLRLGYAGIPLIVAFRTIKSTINCIRFHVAYRVPWYVLPITPVVALGVHLLEVPGMARALRGAPSVRSAYR
ncbi:MAG: glycosyltransferase family 2 protein [Alphaproteobacteria bacterium]|nr:glycosyltransferase family 2 protein [Alphaproteobacteria bacterium]